MSLTFRSFLSFLRNSSFSSSKSACQITTSYPFQSAYSSSHSTETVLLHTVNDSLLAADSGEVSLLTLLDLSAAFDTTDHPILLTRLEYTFGIHNTPLPGSSTVCTTGSKQYLSTTCSPILSNFPVVSLKVLS